MVYFSQAIKWMREDKKVYRTAWVENKYWKLSKEDGIDYGNASTNILHFEANDWEIYEDKDSWNLADQRRGLSNNEEIKKFIRKVKEDIDKLEYVSHPHDQKESIKNIIDKRIGDL